MGEKWIVVTGAAGDIGKAICQVLRRDGFRVYGLDLRTSDFADAGYELDLSDVEAVRNAALHLASERNVVGIVHVAAVQLPTAVGTIQGKDWDLAFAVNVLALDTLVGALVPDLNRANGSVVAISSVHARATSPGMVTYAATKAALESWVRSASMELAPSITVNCVAPGAIDGKKLREGLERWPIAEQNKRRDFLIKRTPAGRVGSGIEIAEAVAFLVSEKSRFTTGTTLRIDGGVASRLSTE